MHIQNFIKIHSFILKTLRKSPFLHQSKAITLLINEFSPFAIPNQPFLPDINVHAKFEENRSKPTQVRDRKGSSDGRTLKRFGGYNIIPRTFCVAGYKKTVIYRRILTGNNVNIGAAVAQSITF